MAKYSIYMLIRFLATISLILTPVQIYGDGIQASGQQGDFTQEIQRYEQLYYADPNNQQLKQSLASLYNNQGVIAAQQKQWQLAESYARKAVDLDPNDNNLKLNLSAIYFQHGYDLYQSPTASYTTDSHNEAKQLAKLALSMNAANVNAYILLGDIEYMDQNMTEAKSAWQNAAQLMPTNTQIQERLAKITREAQTESGMDNRSNAYFIIKIDQSLQQLQNFDIGQALDYARINVGQDFSYTPPHKIPVIVYTPDQYKQTLKGAPEWSEGAFDGKLRIVISSNNPYMKQIKSNIVHEYTHAVIADLANNSCPRWLNEGIAKYEEYKYGIRPLINVLALAYNTNNLIDFNNLNNSLLSQNKNEALLAYQQSFSFVYFLAEKYGIGKVAELLRALGKNQDFPTAVQQVYFVPLTTLEQNWRSWLTNFLNRWAESAQGSGY